MPPSPPPPVSASVSVIIAAYNAETTLARAIRSALAEPETAEVIVVDDASTDETQAVARAEASKDPRAQLIEMPVNSGPAAARNSALDVATADYVAVLDSDDVFLPARLAQLLGGTHTQIIADNIAFVTQTTLHTLQKQDWSHITPEFTPLSTADFVRGNLHRPGVARGELGFLKPLLSRAFLNRHGLRYDPALRLGEDYDLYVRMLLAGAQMSLTRRPGYGAVVRPTSLSAQHGAAELTHLQDALTRHLRSAGLSSTDTAAMTAHLRQVTDKRDHRVFLDLRRAKGPIAALRYAFAGLRRPWRIAAKIAQDKLRMTAMAGDVARNGDVRLLLPTDTSGFR